VAGIGVALSGGGHRAALFGLGVLLYLVDAEKNREVTSIASVSGGSLTNGVVAQSSDYRQTSAEAFSDVARDIASTIVGKGTLWATPLTKLYLVVLLLATAAPVVVWFLPLELLLRALLFVLLLLVFGLFAQLRGVVCGRAFARTLYSPSGRPTRLAEVSQDVDHVFCATDLHAGEHVYFSGRFVCSYRFGFGEPGDLPLHTVVQASAAYPGGFPPRWLPTKRHRFRAAQEEKATGVRRMALVDGGVYDNMADQWGQGVGRRNERWSSLNPGLREPDELVVVNSSAPMRFGSVRKLRIPLLGEAFTFRRDVNVLYDNTTTPRRRLLHTLFTEAMRSRRGLTGTVVQISQSPFDVPSSFAHASPDDPFAQRARNVLAALGDTRSEWEETAELNSAVKTTLSRVRSPAGERLLLHGYVLAMANLHVILDYPLLPVPPLERFAGYVGGSSQRTPAAEGGPSGG
jgi:predicted acylesterase/phospholipase RssA